MLTVHLFIVKMNLDKYLVTPSERHEKKMIRYLLKGVNSYTEFLELISTKKQLQS